MFDALILQHINWDAAHETIHPFATLEVFQCGYFIGQFTHGIIGYSNRHRLAVFTTKTLYLNGGCCPGGEKFLT